MHLSTISRINDHFIDLSQIKSFRLRVQYAGDKEKKVIEIFLKERILKTEDGEIEHSDTIQILFNNQKEAEDACRELMEEWEVLSNKLLNSK